MKWRTILRGVSRAILTAGLCTTTAQAGDISAGKSKAMMCAACHGENGIGTMPHYPNLAGQKLQYLIKQMEDFRSGKRQDPTMNSLTSMLSENDIQDLAAYYSGLPLLPTVLSKRGTADLDSSNP